MKIMKLAVLSMLLIGATQLTAALDMNKINDIVKKAQNSTNPEEVKTMYNEAKTGFEAAKKDVARLQEQYGKLKTACQENWKTVKCAKATVEISVVEAKIKFAQGKEVWNSTLMKKLREVIVKNWPTVKKQLGL